MFEWIQLCGYFAIVFALSAGISYFLTSLKVRRKQGIPIENAVLQLRASSGMYRSRFVGENTVGWIISAPLCRDAYVPIRVGEMLTAWLPTSEGLRSFKSEVLLRDSSTHELTIQKPVSMQAVERRQSPRKTSFSNAAVSVEGEDGLLVDISEGGARVSAKNRITKGERVRLDLPTLGTVFGWTLESKPANDGYEIRVRFEQPIKGF
jgi:hypothetical protein